MNADAIPPHDLATERMVIGACLLDRQACGIALEMLSPEDFYSDTHQAVFRAVARLFADKGAVDRALVNAACPEVRPAYLADCAAECPTTGNVEHYATLVGDAARRRRYMHAAVNLHAAARDPNAGAEELAALAATCTAAAGADTARRSAREVVEDVLKVLAEPAREPRVRTGIADLDRLLGGGLAAGRLYVVGGLASTGKTALVGAIALAAMRCRVRVLFVAAEMTQDEMVRRWMAQLSGVPTQNRASYADDEWGRLGVAGEEVACCAPEVLDSSRVLTVEQLANVARALHLRAPLGLVVVDYIQLLRPTDIRASREQQVAGISHGLKRLAGELKVPLVAVSHLNRNVAEGEEPRKAHLRESGTLEQDPDCILLLWGPADRPASGPGLVNAKLVKNRHGPPGRCDLVVNWDCLRVASQMPAAAAG